MAYTFSIGNDIFVGRTVPGSARMRLHHQSSNRFVAAFDPNTETLGGTSPAGNWGEVSFGVGPELLTQLEPAVLEACRTRYLNIQQAK